MQSRIVNAGAELRSKHVRTLELLQRTLDENKQLKEGVKNPEKDFSLEVQRKEHELLEVQMLYKNEKSEMEQKFKIEVQELSSKVDELTFNLSLEVAKGRLEKEAHEETKMAMDKIGRDRNSIEELRIVKENEKIEIEKLKVEYENRIVEVQRVHDIQLKERDTKYTLEMDKVQGDHQMQVDLLEKTVKCQVDDAKSVFVLEKQQLEKQWKTSTEGLKATIAQFEAKGRDASTEIQRLRLENEQLKANVLQLQNNLKELKAKPSPKMDQLPSMQKSLFAQHVDLKKENQYLRSQVEQMKDTQKRYLGTAKKNNICFPSAPNNQRSRNRLENGKMF